MNDGIRISAQSEHLVRLGYRRVSNSSRGISRVDRTDWREYMAAQHAPGDPTGEGKLWVDALELAHSAADFYRRVYSKDQLVGVAKNVFQEIPSSNFDDTGFVR